MCIRDRSYMDVYDNHILSRARTQYKNIVETLNGTLLAGNEHAYFLRGKVVVATGSRDVIEAVSYTHLVNLILTSSNKAFFPSLKVMLFALIIRYNLSI